MMSKAQKLGLGFTDAIIPDDLTGAEIADSYKAFLRGFYRLTKGPYMRPINAGPRPTGKAGETETAINETIDLSVFDQCRHDPSYRPDNLVAWAKQGKIDLESVRGSVIAASPTTLAAD